MIDAHCHFHFAEIAAAAEEFLAQQGTEYQCLCNGTRPEDWPQVAALADKFDSVRPAYGVHPWQVVECDRGLDVVLGELTEHLRANPQAQVGEIGLDRWMDDYDLPLQQLWLHAQLSIAVELERPVTLHCLKAWGALMETLRAVDLPPSLLVHAYAGSAELVKELVDMGAWFSFSTYFIGERGARKREAFAAMPLERILVETDAPSMCPPPDVSERQVIGDGHNHPGNLALAYQTLAEIREMPVDALAAQVRENFSEFCGR